MHLLPGCVGPLPGLDMHVALPAASLPAESLCFGFVGFCFLFLLFFFFKCQKVFYSGNFDVKEKTN